MGLFDAPAYSRAATDKKFAQRLRTNMAPRYNSVSGIYATPPTIGTVTTTSSVSGSAKAWPAVTNSAGVYKITEGQFTYSCAANPVISGTTSPGYNYIRFTALTNSSSSTADTRFQPYCVDFWHDGTQLEIRLQQSAAASIHVRVDGQRISSTPINFGTTPASDGYVLLTFSTRGQRRIRIESTGAAWGGIVTGLTDNVWPASVGGPRCIIIADSYGEGANGIGAHSGFPRIFGERMGWLDTWASAIGGTGYMNPATGTYPYRKIIRDRLANDVLPYAPDVLIWTAGHNDTSYTALEVQTQVAGCIADVKAAWPNCLQIVTSPLWGPGLRTLGNVSTVLRIRDAIKAAAIAAGVPFLDALQFPLASPVSTTLSSTSGINSTSVILPTVIPVGSYIGINNGNEYNTVTAVTGGGPFTHTLQYPWVRSHSSGEAVVQVGGSIWTGTGRVGAEAGDGNSDFLVSADAVHPTAAGQEAIATWLAAEVSNRVLPQS